MTAGTQEITLVAPDISCGHCVATVQKALEPLDGVQKVNASAETKQIVVDFDPNRISVDRLEAALDDAGYPVQK
ncbi:MAG: heavy-metal-associated domain-containing protein [Thermomicrobiales bacterium]